MYIFARIFVIYQNKFGDAKSQVGVLMLKARISVRFACNKVPFKAHVVFLPNTTA